MDRSGRYSMVLNRASARIAQVLLRNRLPLLVAFLVITAVLGYEAFYIKLDAGFSKSIPTNHPYMKIYREYSPQFGGANVVAIGLMSEQGDIFNAQFLAALEHATRDVLAIPGIDQSSVKSLFTPLAVYITVNEVGYQGGRIVPSDFRPTAEQIAGVRQNLLKSSEIGRLVTRKLDGALIYAELADVDPATGLRLDYSEVGRRLEAIREKYERDGITVQIIGFAKFIHDVIEGTATVIAFFAAVILLTAVLLYLYLGSATLSAVTVVAAFFAVVWELGLVRLLGKGIDPLSVLVPFLVFSIGTSHAVQMVNAWRIAFDISEDPVDSARVAFTRLFIPGTTALLTTATGFAIIMVIDIPIIRDLGVIAGLGMTVMIITNKFLLPILLSYSRLGERARERAKRRARYFESHAIWDRLSACADRRVAVPILAMSVVALGLGYYGRETLMVGDAEIGAPELRSAARYNRDVERMLGNFDVGLDELMIVAKTPDYGCTSFRSMYAIDRFHTTMENRPEVKSVKSLSEELRIRTVGNSEGHPKYYELPRNQYSLGGAMRQMELRQRLYNDECSAIPVRIFATDHRAGTLRALTQAIRQYVDPVGSGVRFELAAGNLGVMAATNEAVEKARDIMLLVLYVVVFALCLLTFLSWRMAVCVLVPLVVVSLFAEAVMAWLGIGLKVSTLPVLALGAGVGVDYGIYLFSRVQHALAGGASLRDAYRESLRNTGTAVIFTAVTMTLGVATWVISPLKFQADMGVLLAYMFFVNMIGAVIILPALAAWLLPVRSKINLSSARKTV